MTFETAVAILKITACLRVLLGQKLDNGEDERAFLMRELESAWEMLDPKGWACWVKEVQEWRQRGQE